MRRKPVSRVSDADADRPGWIDDALNGHRSTFPVIFDRVGKKVDKDLLDPHPVCHDENGDLDLREGHSDATLPRLGLYHGLAFMHDFGQ